MPATSRNVRLNERRERLRQRCEAERQQLAREATAIEADLGRIDRGVRLTRAVFSKPVIVTASIAAVTMLGPGRVLRLLTRGLALWSTARRVAKSFR
jgi:hypothetical protein